MSLATVFSILDCNDIAYIIFDQLDFVTLSSVAPVCKRFLEFSQELYRVKLNAAVINPAKQLYNDFCESTLQSYLSKSAYSLDFSIQRRNFVNMLFEFEDFIDPFINKNYWILLVYDLDIMEKIFMFVSRINNMIELHKNTIFFDIRMVDEDRTNQYHRLMSIFDILDNYLYVEYPDRYINSQLHMMAKFKKIVGESRLKRLHLIRSLTRPKDEVYYIDA